MFSSAKQMTTIRSYLAEFCRVAFCLFAITLIHRYLASDLHFDLIDFKGTYNQYDGFDPSSQYKHIFVDSLVSGIKADALFSLIAAFFMAFLRRKIQIVCMIVLSFFYAINLEHIRYNLTSIDFSLIGTGLDLTFIRAQFTADLMDAFARLLFTTAIVVFISRKKTGLGISAMSSFVLLLSILIPNPEYDIAQPRWLYEHPLLANVVRADLEVDARAFVDEPFTPSRGLIHWGKTTLNTIDSLAIS